MDEVVGVLVEVVVVDEVDLEVADVVGLLAALLVEVDEHEAGTLPDALLVEVTGVLEAAALEWRMVLDPFMALLALTSFPAFTPLSTPPRSMDDDLELAAEKKALLTMDSMSSSVCASPISASWLG